MVCDYNLKIGQLLETCVSQKGCKANELKLENIISCHPMLIIPSILFSNSWMLTDLNGANTVWESETFQFFSFFLVCIVQNDNGYWTFFYGKFLEKTSRMRCQFYWFGETASYQERFQDRVLVGKKSALLTLLSSNVSVRTINSSIHYFCLTFLVI